MWSLLQVYKHFDEKAITPAEFIANRARVLEEDFEGP